MLLRDKPIASPLNYIGGKYKLLPQIFPLFPDNVDTFVDIFCGGCNVGINASANRIICNDLDSNLIGLFNYFKSTKHDVLKKKIDTVIEHYKLSDSQTNGYKFYNCNSGDGLCKYNRDKFLKLRTDFNSLDPKSENYYLYLYVLIVYAFNNQIRFNSEGKYNLPIGKRDFNIKMQNKLESFLSNISSITFQNQSFTDIIPDQLNENDFVYADPPYLITCAGYNENNGWNENLENQLLSYLDSLTEKNIKFALSNVLSSDGKTNTILLNWITDHPNYICHHLNYSYKNSNYHKKNSSEKADEVLITNY